MSACHGGGDVQTTEPNPTRGQRWDTLPPPSVPPGPGISFGSRLKSRMLRMAPRALVSLLAKPYIAGETRAQAIDLTRRMFQRRGLHSTIDLLGEDITDPGETAAILSEYIAILEDLGPCPHTNISIKLSALGQALDDRLCEKNLETLLSRASAYDQFVRFDMEDHTTTDSTLSIYRRYCGRF